MVALGQVSAYRGLEGRARARSQVRIPMVEGWARSQVRILMVKGWARSQLTVPMVEGWARSQVISLTSHTLNSTAPDVLHHWHAREGLVHMPYSTCAISRFCHD